MFLERGGKSAGKERDPGAIALILENVKRTECYGTAMINIALSCDKHYVTQYTVTVASILKFHPSDIDFYLIQDRMSVEDYAPLERVIQRMGRNCRLIPVEVGKNNWEGWPTHKAWPQAVYYRLGLPELLPQLDRIIDIDGDVLVADDIQQIWDVPLEGHPAAAVCIQARRPHIKAMEGHEIFNNGVMVSNLKFMRENNMKARILEIAEKYREQLLLMDEDIMNLAYQDQMVHLPYRWNVITALAKRDSSYTDFPVEMWEEAVRHPAAIHFNVCKPWKTSGSIKTPFVFLYSAYMKLVDDLPWGFRARVYWKCTFHLFQRYKYTAWQKEHMQLFRDSMNDIRRKLL